MRLKTYLLKERKTYLDYNINLLVLVLQYMKEIALYYINLSYANFFQLFEYDSSKYHGHQYKIVVSFSDCMCERVNEILATLLCMCSGKKLEEEKGR